MKKYSLIAASSLLALSMMNMGGALAATDADPIELNICSGSEGGFYNTMMKAIGPGIVNKYRGKTPIKINVEPSTGTVANLEALADGNCSIVIAQADGVVQRKDLPSGLSVSNMHEEAVYLLINKKIGKAEGIDDLTDLEGREDLHLAVVEGSGALVTLRNFVEEDSGYKPNLDKAVYFEDMYDAAEAVANGEYRVAGKTLKIAAMLYVSRPGAISNEILEDFRTRLVVGEATDKDFNDAEDASGAPLYRNCEIDSKQLQGMDGASWGDQSTVCVRAQVLFDTQWLKKFKGRDATQAKRAVKKAINRIASQFN